jgi:hypothetical protein
MNVIIPPTKSFVYKKEKNNKPIYTVYKHNTGLFSIQLKDFRTDTLKTTVFGFNKEKDALKFACMIEDHRDITKEWPQKENDEENSFRLYENKLSKRIMPNILEIQQWDILELKTYCMLNFTDLLQLSNVYRSESDNFKIQGNLIRIDAPVEYQAEILKIIYDKE